MLRVTETLAWIAGLCLIGTYVGWRLLAVQASSADVQTFQQARSQVAAASLAGSPPVHASPQQTLHSDAPDTSTWSPKRLAEYKESLQQSATAKAVLRIPRLGLQVPVYEGTDDFALNRGAGHIDGTADLTSERGNAGIAAHRDGFFRPLKDIAVGDEMFLDTLTATRRYTVTLIHVVDPSSVEVLDGTPTATLTLVTCYPFYFVGSAPRRFIVRAQIAEPSLANRG